ncbi:MAG: tetraacyldisaccharide 4'-kinase [Ignavibacteriota bacterium]
MNFTDAFNPYSYAMQLRRWLYRKRILRSTKLSIPVISIGNLSMGGTGKTPLTLLLADYCTNDLAKRTAIVLRGYKRQSSGLVVVSNGSGPLVDVRASGDEAQLYAKEIPSVIVICDEDRVRGGKHAISLGAEIILLDDGFQHLRLARDLNIILINSDEGIPAVLPFGKGRENMSAVADADLLIRTNASDLTTTPEQPGDIPQILIRSAITGAKIFSADTQIDALPEILSGRRILAVSAIGNPVRFEQMLAAIPCTVIPFRLPDHAEYDAAKLLEITEIAAKSKCDFIVTTTKDSVKMAESYIRLLEHNTSLPPLVVIQADLEFLSGKSILFTMINDLFNSRK